MERVRKGGTRYFDRDGREITREEYEKLQSGRPDRPKEPKSTNKKEDKEKT